MSRTTRAVNVLMCSVAAAGALCAVPAAAQNFPNRVVRVINPNQPGGNSDVLFRLLSGRMSEALGQQVVVDYRPGAGGNIGAELSAKAPPDGYTTLIAAASFLINPSVIKNLPFDATKDFTPLGLIVDIPAALVTHPSLPVKSVKELIALAKARPADMFYSSSGTGAVGHLSGELFKGFIVSSGFSYLGPAGIAKPVVDKLNGALVHALRDPNNRKALIDRGANPIGSTPAEHGAYIKAEIEKWHKVAAQAGLTPK